MAADLSASMPALSSKAVAHNVLKESLMKTVLRIFGLLLMALGVIWFLQGINVLPGSFMTGQTKWAIYGGISFVLGLGLFTASKRRSDK